MSLRVVTVLIATLLAAPALSASSAPGAEAEPAPATKLVLDPSRVPHARGELLVRFRDGVGRARRDEVHGRHGAGRVDRVRRVGLDHVRLRPGVSEREALASYAGHPLVERVSLNLLRAPLAVPNDPRYGEQWSLRNTGQAHPLADPPPAAAAGTAGADIDADALTEDGTTSTIIAILDTGVSVAHADLNDALWKNPAEEAGDPGVDDDDNGYVDDLHGCDFTDDVCTSLIDAPATSVENSHGTHVAGIAAAEADNSIGIAGACPGCKLMVLKIADQGEFPVLAEVKALEYLRAMKAVLPGTRFIVNASFGGPVWSQEEFDAIQALAEDDILFVAAAGNAAMDNDLSLGGPGLFASSPSFPSAYNLPNVIAVAASTHKDEYGYGTGCNLPSGGARTKWSCLFTSWGRRSVDLAAPGVDITSTLPGNTYGTWNGTSMASPLVAGVAGLVWSADQTLTAVEVRAKILNGVDRPAALDTLPLRGKQRTGAFSVTRDGRLSADGALTASAERGSEGHDGTISGARRLASEARGVVSWPGDVNDVYRKSLKPGVYRVVLRAGDNDFDLYVWKRSTTEIWQYEEACFFGTSSCKLLAQRATPSGIERVRRLRITAKGRYYIHVSAFLFESGSYKLRIKRIG